MIADAIVPVILNRAWIDSTEAGVLVAGEVLVGVVGVNLVAKAVLWTP
jgi:hypothetical protein